MKDLREYMDDVTIEIKELWFDIGNQEQSKIRILFNYLHSKRLMYDQHCSEWRTQLQEDVNDYLNIERYLTQLQDPYAFLNFQNDREAKVGMTFDGIAEEQDAKMQFKKQYPKLHKVEKEIVDKYVNKYTNRFVQKLGYRRANWLPCIQVMLFFMIILNIMACYARPDFLTTLVCTLTIFFLNDTEDINRDKFRSLPLIILISIIYDAIWLFSIQNMQREGAQAEGGLEQPVKQLAIQVAYIAFIFKVSSFLIGDFFSSFFSSCFGR